MLRSGDGRAFAAAGTLGIDRVSGVPVIFCSSSLAESRPCTHRTHVDHQIGLKIPFVAPAPFTAELRLSYMHTAVHARAKEPL